MGTIFCYDQYDDVNKDERMEMTEHLIYNQWIDIKDYIDHGYEMVIFIHKKHRVSFNELFNENKRKLEQNGYNIVEENGDMYFRLDDKLYYSDKHE